MPTLICDCNKTMPLKAVPLGQALHEELTLHSSLCRREAGAFERGIQQAGDLVVACTQEQRLFREVAAGTQGATAPVRFVNIRETGGWSRDAARAMPKIAALLAAAHLPDPDPVATVTYRSEGRLLVIGPMEQAERAAALVGDALDVTIFTQGGAGAQERSFPVLGGRIERLQGWLGAFELAWTADNPIDLDLCTRCNACIAVCPEGAIGLDYQIDAALCRSHRDCVKACAAAGAIDFDRPARSAVERFDLVLDLRHAPAFLQHARPQGYFHLPVGDVGWGEAALATVLKLRELVGEFEKPRFVAYQQKLCAHSRNEQIGCNACIEICSAEAITSQPARQQVKVNANLCVGCGACASVCPTGAMSYAYPPAPVQGRMLRTLLSTYREAGGKSPMLLLHSRDHGQALVQELGRAAQLGVAQGVPANVIPIGLWHAASTGIEVWLSAVAMGASCVAVLTTPDDAPQYVDALRAQMGVAQVLLNGLGYEGRHFSVLRVRTQADLDQELQLLVRQGGSVPREPARFAFAPEKRTTLELALDHLVEHASQRPEVVALPPGAALGTVAVDKERCTLCLSCVGACPAGALQDNALSPQLRLVEKNCVQCRLCAKTCPEQAITLRPRLLLGGARRESRVLNEAQPYACIRCGKPFGTAKAVETMLARLAGHAMFQGTALERVKMCGDCRVIDIYSCGDEARITDL
ncbi:MAG TPA: 4Fe-4S dicluster domain-containing protein [Ramlibacter sp.]|nr:4Fe-4S dicluster domain-containing protein [Ramlibacter sp.]